MQQKYTYKEIIKYYLLSYKEIYESLIALYISSIKIKKVFNSEEMISKLKKEVENYLNNVYKEMEVLKFIFKNERNLYVSDICGFLDEIDNNFEARYYFYEKLYENLMTAFDMNLDYKFYIPRKRYKELTDEDVKKYISYVKGFNENRVKNFLAEEEVINFEKFNEVISNAKIINGNVKDNIELYGIYSNKVVLPKIDEQLSTLINIHEFTHYSLIDNQEKFLIDDWIVNGEDIPIFYELLFKENNSFIDIDIHTTNKALELLKTYNNEPFEEQIKKLKRIK